MTLAVGKGKITAVETIKKAGGQQIFVPYLCHAPNIVTRLSSSLDLRSRGCPIPFGF